MQEFYPIVFYKTFLRFSARSVKKTGRKFIWKGSGIAEM